MNRDKQRIFREIIRGGLFVTALALFDYYKDRSVSENTAERAAYDGYGDGMR